jgi:phosphate:Na+ symporter
MLIIRIFCGLVLFLIGMKIMSSGLERLCGSTFAQAVRHFTGSRLSAFLVGILFTAITQSSSLATVIVIGVVDAGIIGLSSAIAVIIGANVGTTVTGQLLSFHLHDYAPYLVAFGGLFALFANGGKREAGRSVMGLGVLLFGLQNMASSLSPVMKSSWATAFLQAAGVNPLTGILAGAAVTAVVQSSSAVVGTVITLSKEGVLSLAAGAGILVGADVGTCVTSLLAGLGTGLNARRAALSHLLFNVFSLLLIIPFFPLFVSIAAASADTIPRQLANAHTLYNLSGAVLLLLFLRPFQSLVERLTTAENTDKKRIFKRFGEMLEKWF